MLSSQQGIACRHVVRFYGVSAMVALTIISPIALLDGLIQKYLGEAILTFMAFVIMAYREEKYYDPAIATVLFQIALLFVLGTAISCLTALALLPAAWHFTPRLEGARCTLRGTGYLVLAAFLNSVAQIALMNSLLTAGVAYTVPIYSASPLVVLILAAIFMRQRERLTARLAWAVFLTVAGAALVTASRHGLLG